MGGGQFKQLVKAMIEAESQPIKQMEARKGREEAKLKLFQEFKSKFANMDKAINELSSFNKFRDLKVDLGDGANIVSVTLDKDKATPGSHLIQVDELAARTSAISNGFESPDEPLLGSGFITMGTADGGVRDVYVDSEKSSLREIASVINAQTDLPIQASVLKDSSDLDAPWKLILTGKKEGVVNEVTFPEFYFIDGTEDFYLDSDREARNAKLLVDEIPVELESNKVVDFLPGVNLQLKSARPDQPFTITISEDNQKIAGKVKELVTQLNGVLEFIVKQNTIDKDSDTTKTFAGDTGLQTIEYRIRNLLHEGFPFLGPESEEYQMVFLNQMGVEFDKKGTVQFSEEKFNKALDSNFDKIAQAITGPMGFASQLKSVVEMYTRSNNGMLAMRETSLKSRIKEIDKQIDNKSRMVERKTQALTDQFSRLQGTLGKMQQQQQYIAATMGSQGGSPIAQLMGG